MADGSIKDLIDVMVDDMVMAFDRSVFAFVPARVNGLYHTDPLPIERYSYSGGFFECSKTCKIMVNRRGLTFLHPKRAVVRQAPTLIRLPHGVPFYAQLFHEETLEEREPTMGLTFDHPDHALVCEGDINLEH
jgi:hypothetical protein